MSHNRLVILLSFPLLVLLGGMVRSDDKLPDYRPVPDWPKLPETIKLGPVSAVATDSSGRVYVFHRDPRPILVFEREGTFVRSFGDGLLKTPHGLRVDHENNIWVTDM